MEPPGREKSGNGVPARVPAVGRGAEDRLYGWKEIASHLRHGIRTVQRWEQREGLPVHRHPHEKRDAVYAYRSELDNWWRTRGFRLVEAPRRPAPVELRVELQGSPPQPVKKRPRWLLWAAAAVVVLAAAAWLVLGPLASVGFTARDWVVIADFDNQTGEPVFDRALWTAFLVSLQQSAHVNVVSRPRMERALIRMGKKSDERIDESLAEEVCVREGARLLIACSIARFGSQYVISARLVDPHTGEPVHAYLERAGSQGQILATIGRLARRIRRDLGESLRSVQAESHPLPAVTTPSLLALKEYDEGDRLWRKGKYKEAVASFESALSRDPGFAMAHAALASAYLSHIFYDPARAKSHFEQAMKDAARLTDREWLFIQASYHARMNHVDEAIGFYHKLLDRFPADVTAHHNLGTLLMLNGRLEDAERHLREASRLAPTGADTLINLASISRLLGRPQIALKQYARAFELEPEWITTANINHEYGFGLVQAGDAAAARKVFQLALPKPGMKSLALRSLALLDLYEGKYRDAEAQLRQAIAEDTAERQPLREARNRLFLAILEEGRGNLENEIRELRRALRAKKSDPGLPVWLAARVGARFARAGALPDAERMLKHVSAQADRKNLKDLCELHLLEGEIAAARGQHDRAVALFRSADAVSSSPLTLSALAGAFRRAGRADEALATYMKLLERGHLALGWEPQQDWLAAHADLAELYLRQGEAQKSEQALAFLARLWSGADRGLPLTRRIAALQQDLTRAKAPPKS